MDVLHKNRLLWGWGWGASAHWIHDKNHSSTRAATLLLSLWGLQVERELDDAQRRASQFGCVRERGDNCQCVHLKINQSYYLFSGWSLCGAPGILNWWETSFTRARCASCARHNSSSVHFDRALLFKSFPFPTTFTYYLHCKLVFLSDVRMYPCSAAKFTRSRDSRDFSKLRRSQTRGASSSERHSVVDPNPFKQAATNSGGVFSLAV